MRRPSSKYQPIPWVGVEVFDDIDLLGCILDRDDELIGSGAAAKTILARPTAEDIVTAAAFEQVVARCARELIVAGAAIP